MLETDGSVYRASHGIIVGNADTLLAHLPQRDESGTAFCLDLLSDGPRLKCLARGPTFAGRRFRELRHSKNERERESNREAERERKILKLLSRWGKRRRRVCISGRGVVGTRASDETRALPLVRRSSPPRSHRYVTLALLFRSARGGRQTNVQRSPARKRPFPSISPTRRFHGRASDFRYYKTRSSRQQNSRKYYRDQTRRWPAIARD